MKTHRSAADILGDFGIRLKSSAPGRYYSTCPECSHTRKTPHQRLQCLGVTIASVGVKFGCNHCGWTGGGYYERLSLAERVRAPRRCSVDDDTAKRSAFAFQIWNEAKDPRGSLVARYLASRGLELTDDLAESVIRFHPALKYSAAYTGGMLALFRDINTNEPCGIHRTFLDGAGRKVDRKMLGRAGGAAIKLDADASVMLGLHLGEGIETCMAARLAGFRPVWALGSANAIASFPVLAGVEAITILGEVNDGGANDRAATACAARWINAGHEAFIVRPLLGGDLNDVWREVA
jgi:putative DNA primase/helicase